MKHICILNVWGYRKTNHGRYQSKCWRSQRVLSAADDNTSLDLHNSSDDTQLHSIMLWSHQALQQTNSGCVHDQPGLPVPEGSFMWDFWMQLCVHLCIYITAFASISSTALEIEALSFAVNRFRKKQKNVQNTNKVWCGKLKTESTRKLSNFYFQWGKTLYQNNLTNIAFFFTFFRGLRCNNKSSVVTPKKIFHGR